MADPLLCPEYTIDIHCADQEQADRIHRVLIQSQDLKSLALKSALENELWEFFTGMVDACVEQNNFDHDGYRFDWERSPELLIDLERAENSPVLTIVFSINVLVKNEDFAAFENLLQNEKFGFMYREATKAAVIAFMAKVGLIIPEDRVAVTESGFGYG
ncbi:MAG: hypothetical protein ABI273_19740 [Lacunisphaera sp.]